MPDAAVVTEVTLGEVYRLQVGLADSLAELKQSVDKRPTWPDLDRMKAARDATELLQNQAIKQLEDNNRWVVRTVGASLITGLGGLVAAFVALGNLP